MARMIEPVACIRIELRDLEPTIWRRVDVPLSSSLAALNDIIQVSFHWQDYHLYEFVVCERVYCVPTDEDEFYDRKVYKASAIRLRTLVERGVDRFLYVYDFGDDWRHNVFVEEVRDGDRDTEYPSLVNGARRCPPEDVGETDGFVEFLEAVLDRDPRRARPDDGVVRRPVRPGGHRGESDPADTGDVRRPPPRPAGEPSERQPRPSSPLTEKAK